MAPHHNASEPASAIPHRSRGTANQSVSGVIAPDEKLCRRPVPVIDPLKSIAHERRPLTVGQSIGDAKRLDPLLVTQHSDGPGPVGAPHAAIEAESVEDATERIPDVFVGGTVNLASVD